MRILRIIRSVRPDGGGPIEGIRQVSKVQCALGHSVEIASLDAPEDDWVKGSSIRVHALGPVRSKYGYGPSVVDWIRNNASSYDTVVVSGLWQYHSFAVWRALRKSGQPYFVFPHGMLDPWFRRTYPLKHLKKWMYWPWSDYRVLRDARAVLFTSEEERRRARESFWLYSCRERVVSYGTSAPSGDPEAQKEHFLSLHPELRDRELILFLGRLHPKKGADLLLRGFARLLRCEELPPALRARLHLVMAGPPAEGYGETLRNLATDLGIGSRVTWPGMLSGEPKWGAFRASQVFVLPSHQENFGIAVAESMACGVPVLISNQVNIWREISGDGAGLVEEDTELGTFKLLRRWFLLSGEDQSRMRAAALRSFKQRFEISRVAERMICDFNS